MSGLQAYDGGRPLRPLLPATPRPATITTAPSVGRARPSHISAACRPCRKQKTKCSGERPVCDRCVKRNTECHYTTRPGETEAQARNRAHGDLRDRTTTHREILELLRNLPDRDAQGVLQSIRAGTDFETIVKHVRAGDLLLQMSVRPETRYRYDFPYRSGMPEEYLADNPYMDSLVYEAAALYSANGPPARSKDIGSKSVTALSSEEYNSFYLKPLHAATVIEPRLLDAKISAWTSVCDNDTLMRDLLSSWLRCEYSFTAAFQKNLFLQDLVTGNDEFCSSLLVNIVLGYSCVS